MNEFKQAMATLATPVIIDAGIMKRTSDFKISLKKMKKTASASNSAASLSAHSGMHSARSASVNSALSKRNIVENVESALQEIQRT
jgi:N-acetylmuramoyl-L-alanine amidase